MLAWLSFSVAAANSTHLLPRGGDLIQFNSGFFAARRLARQQSLIRYASSSSLARQYQ
jgi:hypothetical protein